MTDDTSEEKNDDAKGKGLVKTVNGITTLNLWQRGDDLPAIKKRLDFKNRTGDFVVTICYDETSEEFLPAGEDKLIGAYPPYP